MDQLWHKFDLYTLSSFPGLTRWRCVLMVCNAEQKASRVLAYATGGRNGRTPTRYLFYITYYPAISHDLDVSFTRTSTVWTDRLGGKTTITSGTRLRRSQYWEPETKPAGTKPRASQCRSPGGEKRRECWTLPWKDERGPRTVDKRGNFYDGVEVHIWAFLSKYITTVNWSELAHMPAFRFTWTRHLLLTSLTSVYIRTLVSHGLLVYCTLQYHTPRQIQPVCKLDMSSIGYHLYVCSLCPQLECW